MKARIRLPLFLRKWHRRLGLVAALFFVFLGASGIALNHTEELNLDSIVLSQPALLAWYGLRPDVPDLAYPVGTGFFAASEAIWVMDGKLLGRDLGVPIGAVEINGARYVASGDTLFVYLPDGTPVEKMQDGALPAKGLMALGTSGDQLVVKTKSGVFGSADGVNWQSINGAAVAWAAGRAMPAAQRDAWTPLFAPTLTLERVLLDLHSGRLFGRFGPWAFDAVALILLVLVLSGVWIYLRGDIRRR
jgi:uncharacterized iron-regulated membrane protein